MTESLTAVIARWPHAGGCYKSQSDKLDATRTTVDCRRCQMERWRDEWMKRAKSISTGEIGYEFRSEVLGIKEGE